MRCRCSPCFHMCFPERPWGMRRPVWTIMSMSRAPRIAYNRRRLADLQSTRSRLPKLREDRCGAPDHALDVYRAMGRRKTRPGSGYAGQDQIGVATGPIPSIICTEACRLYFAASGARDYSTSGTLQRQFRDRTRLIRASRSIRCGRQPTTAALRLACHRKPDGFEAAG